MTSFLPANIALPNLTAAYVMDEWNHTGASPYYWGPPDALVDWCELNFMHTPYVAEFYNTMTHVPAAMYCVTAAILMSIPSWTHAYSHADGHGMHGKPLEGRFQATLLGLAFVCTGSALFHASLRYWAQLLDEIPMLFVVGSFIYCLNRRRGGPQHALFNLGLAAGLSLIVVISVILYVYRQQYILFVGCYVVGTLALIYQSIALAVSGAGLDITQDPVGVRYRRKLLARSVTCYVFAGICWVVERLTCPHQKAPIPICAGTLDTLGMSSLSAFCFFVPYLHAVWHVFSVLGAYELILFLALATGDNRASRTITRCKVTYMGIVA